MGSRAATRRERAAALTRSRARRAPGADSLRPVDHVMSHLFFFLFVAQIFSPLFGGVTLYLEVVVAVLHPRFVRWVWNLKPAPYPLAITVVTAAVLSVHSLSNLVKVAALIISVLYLVFAHRSGLFHLYRWITVSVALAVVQWTLVTIGTAGSRELARTLGPKALSEAVWGEHATQTFTNFYAVIGDSVRVSGLSREGGFFASLLVGTLMVIYLDPRSRYRTRHALTAGLGIMLSLSKTTFVLPGLYLLVRARRLINHIPSGLAVLAFFAVSAGWAVTNESTLVEQGNRSFLHRFGAYTVVSQMDPGQLLWGEGSISAYSGDVATTAGVRFEEFAGTGGFLLAHGIVGVALWLLAVHALGGSTTSVVYILGATVAVSPTTNQNFVVLAYFAALYLLPRFDVEQALAAVERKARDDARTGPRRGRRLALAAGGAGGAGRRGRAGAPASTHRVGHG
ncbi:hypothetical protein [Demequina gelatinilytica]|uniref:hypothetical protein n=1 Tax=Demequina gelatinilytica TaxID=1638980 RepID=UPI0007803AF8|nr:hypothetical protein [Demequina gelatinilytica]